jgi:hypothetical protein
MPPRLKMFVILVGLTIFLGIIELVRRRKLREEYSFIWLMIGFVFLALIFVMLLCLYFSLRISALTTQVKNLAQQFALLQAKNEGGQSSHK